MLIPEVPEFTRPINSSMILGGCPAAGITVGATRSLGMVKRYMQISTSAIDFSPHSLTVLLRLDYPRRLGIGLTLNDLLMERRPLGIRKLIVSNGGTINRR